MSSRLPPPTPNLSNTAAATATTTPRSSSDNSHFAGRGLGLGLASHQSIDSSTFFHSHAPIAANMSQPNQQQPNQQQQGFQALPPPFPYQQGGYLQQPQQYFPQNPMGLQHAAVNLPGYESDDEDDENSGSDLPAIHLRVSTPLHVSGNGNVVSINAADNAARVGFAVAQSLRQIGTVGGGVPMIDEDGKPRPIDVKVSAATVIRGSNNVVGEKAVLSKTIIEGPNRRIDPTQQGGPAADRHGPKRARAASEPDVMDPKKARRD
ncbi:hypothetical protein BJ875DRAFT_450141 [Amylocarpus encephaloides]|uniref:Uncharacterized protein n=1 Tax=Amylocarpus encephaloides TaxID=45428 RepID=A0A9P8C9D2_9HELO|nr:hypothetical protein BJ875DRAFT_450141 [Amylocarpus encephaloides]